VVLPLLKEEEIQAPTKSSFEEEGVNRVRVRRVISRQHPIKTMFMGVITQPMEKHNFSGVLTIKQFSKQQ
jgi:hypothetical protein